VSDLRLCLRQTAFVMIGFRRNARAVTLTVVMPIVLLVLFNSILGGNGSGRTTLPSGGTITLHAYFTAGIMAYAIMLTGFSSLLIGITTAREAGRLKRYRGTPMPSWVFLSAQILANIAVVIVMAVALLVIGQLAFNINVPAGAIGPLAVYVLVGTATMCSLGIALSRVTTSADAATAIGPFTTVILAFISGVFVQASQLPSWLRQLGLVFPLAHLAEGLQSALALHHQAFRSSNLAALAVWLVVGLVLAVRTFAWEPLGAGT
jgi:ABC-2 type transport system permease protein